MSNLFCKMLHMLFLVDDLKIYIPRLCSHGLLGFSIFILLTDYSLVWDVFYSSVWGVSDNRTWSQSSFWAKQAGSRAPFAETVPKTTSTGVSSPIESTSPRYIVFAEPLEKSTIYHSPFCLIIRKELLFAFTQKGGRGVNETPPRKTKRNGWREVGQRQTCRRH